MVNYYHSEAAAILCNVIFKRYKHFEVLTVLTLHVVNINKFAFNFIMKITIAKEVQHICLKQARLLDVQNDFFA